MQRGQVYMTPFCDDWQMDNRSQMDNHFIVVCILSMHPKTYISSIPDLLVVAWKYKGQRSHHDQISRNRDKKSAREINLARR